MARRPQKQPTSSAEDLPPLSVESAVRESLGGAPEVLIEHAVLVATALTLARKLDEGAGLATAAVARELRCTVEAITKAGQVNDDELDDFVTGLGVPAPLGNSTFR